MEIDRSILLNQCEGLLEIILYLMQEEKPQGNIIFSKVDKLFTELSVEMKLTQDEYETFVAIQRRI